MKEVNPRAETMAHIMRVAGLLMDAAAEMLRRAKVHDASKLVEPEASLFEAHTHKLAALTYGSPEYMTATKDPKELGPAIEHHWANNTHHPEHYENGVNDMDLYDVLEMLVDWKAAGERQNNGNIMTSLERNRARFKISDQLYAVLKNHAHRYLRA